MKKVSNQSSEPVVAEHERNEKAKKLYRYINEVARRLDDVITASLAVEDLFTIKNEVQRQKLRDNCEKLLFLDPLNYGKKSIELLWRKVYYDTISASKKLKQSNNENENLLFTHIVCGIGQFHSIITKIQSNTKLLFDHLDYCSSYKDEDCENLAISQSDELQCANRNILHNCLIYLGDLSRYQVEIFNTHYDPSIAARYYHQAAQIDLSSGMPYNQLGNLYLDKNHNIDSVCYYIHCLSCSEAFEGALGNLSKLFDKNSQNVSLGNSDSLTQCEIIQETLTAFLSLIEIWYMGKDDADVPERCNMIAHQLKVSMDFKQSPLPDINKSYSEYLQAVEEENINPSYMNSGLVHKIVLICLFTIAKLDETEEKKAFACKAFTLALLSQLLRKLFQQLESLGLENPANKFRKPSTNQVKEPDFIEEPVEQTNPVEIDNGVTTKDEAVANVASHSHSDDDASEVVNGDAKSSKSANKRRRRRRAASCSNGTSDESETDSDNEATTEDSMSDDDNLSDSSFESEDKESDDSASEEKITPDIATNGSVTTKKNNNVVENGHLTNGTSGLMKQADSDETKVSLMKNFLAGDNFLPSIKILLDWALNEKELIQSCGESGESLFQCVVDLLNTFTFNFKPNKKHSNKTCEVLDYAKKLAENLELEYKSIPLPEDLNLRGTNICKFDKHAAEWQILNRYRPSVYEENVIRILNFIDFGNQIAKLVPRIRQNRSMQILYLKKTAAPKTKAHVKVNHKKTREWHNSKKPHGEGGESGLLRRLGRLWLAARVRELERSGGPPPPALLALDAAALTKHLRKVKQLLKARAFVLLVPAIVLQELDELKRDESSARDAIRWLETQLQGGSRGVRAQRPGQARPLPRIKYPRKAPPHVHNFIQILEYCHHFVAEEKTQGGNGDPDDSLQAKAAPLLVLLVGNEPGTAEEYKEFSMTGAAQAAGVTVEYIGHFYAKWRQSAHKAGTKR